MTTKRKPNYNKYFMRTHRRTHRELVVDLLRQGWKKLGPFFVPNKKRSKR